MARPREDRDEIPQWAYINVASRRACETFKAQWLAVIERSSREDWSIERQAAALNAISFDRIYDDEMRKAKLPTSYGHVLYEFTRPPSAPMTFPNK